MGASIQCSQNCRSGSDQFAVAFGVINMFLVPLLFWFTKLSSFITDYVLVVYGLWWIAGFLTLTFSSGRFMNIGNGYFAVTLGTFAAMNAIAIQNMDEELEDNENDID